MHCYVQKHGHIQWKNENKCTLFLKKFQGLALFFSFLCMEKLERESYLFKIFDWNILKGSGCYRRGGLKSFFANSNLKFHKIDQDWWDFKALKCRNWKGTYNHLMQWKCNENSLKVWYSYFRVSKGNGSWSRSTSVFFLPTCTSNLKDWTAMAL